jgi:hypothetical protein
VATRLIKRLFELGCVAGIAAMEQASRPRVNRHEIVRSLGDSGARERKHYQGGEKKNQKMQIRLGKLHGLPES